MTVGAREPGPALHRPFALVLGGGGARGFAHAGVLPPVHAGDRLLADGAYSDLRAKTATRPTAATGTSG